MQTISPLLDLADDLSARQGLHPAARDRAAIARLATVPIHRPPSAPNYASDLGVRVTDDPQIFLVASARRVGVDAGPCVKAVTAAPLVEAWLRQEVDENGLAGQLDAIISFAGAWRVAADVAAAVLQNGALPREPRALTSLAAGLASRDDCRVEQLYASVDEERGASVVEASMSCVRRAAWVAKRRQSPERAAELLRGRSLRLDRAVAGRCLSPDDALVLRGVVLNLEALTAVMTSDQRRAAYLLEEAEEHLASQQIVMVDDDRRRRYLAQVVVNRAQLSMRQGEWGRGRDRLLEHVHWTRTHHQESLSEALALAGYAAYRCYDWGRAIPLLREAVVRIEGEGAPSRVRRARESLAAALFRGGAEAEGARVLEHSQLDPCGLVASPECDA